MFSIGFCKDDQVPVRAAETRGAAEVGRGLLRLRHGVGHQHLDL